MQSFKSRMLLAAIAGLSLSSMTLRAAEPGTDGSTATNVDTNTTTAGAAPNAADAKAAAAASKAAEKTAAANKKAEEKAAKDKAKADAKEAKDREKAEKEEAKKAAAAEKEAAKQTAKQPEQNGITRPHDGTKTGRVWGIADEISATIGAPASIKAVSEQGAAEGINDATIRTQYARWRKFHGVTGYVVDPRVAEEKAAKEAKAAEEKAAKEAAKNAAKTEPAATA